MKTYDSYEIFVNRDTPKKLFADAVNNIPIDGKSVLVFHGPGGQGKTALRHELLRSLKPKDKKDTSYKHIRTAALDLQERERTDKERLLVWIRNAFSKTGVSFPTFDIAFALYWQSARGDEQMPTISNAWLHRVYEFLPPGAEGVMEALSPGDSFETDALTPGVGLLFGSLVNWFVDKTKKAYIWQTRDCLQALMRDDEIISAAEISNLLPKMLAEDLNHYAAEHSELRFVLAIDTYELLMPQGGADNALRENPFNDQIRELCYRTKALLTVIFGREPLDWQHRFDYQIDLAGNQHSLAGLGVTDASLWLNQAGVEDKKICNAMIKTATVSEENEDTRKNSIYPLLLQLQLWHWQSLGESGKAITAEEFETTGTTKQQRSEKIIERVLRDYDTPFRLTLDRMAVADRFDQSACDYIIRTFNTGMPADQFETMRKLSFVSEDENGFLSLHRATAEAIRSTLSKERYQSSLDALFKHYETRSNVEDGRPAFKKDILALNEACALKQRIDINTTPQWLWGKSSPFFGDGKYAPLLTLWQSTYNKLNKESHPECHFSCLVALAWLHLGLGSLKEAVSYLKQANALQKNNTIDPPVLAEFYSVKAAYYRARIEHPKAIQSTEKAIALISKSGADKNGSLSGFLNDIALSKLALRQYSEAEDLLRQAITIGQKQYPLEHPYMATRRLNLGITLSYQGQYTEAIQTVENAISDFRQYYQDNHPSLANYLVNLAGIHEQAGNNKKAIKLAEKALKVQLNSFRKYHPQTGLIFNNLGSYWANEGDFTKAINYNQKAADCYARIPGQTSHAVLARNNLAKAQTLNGDLKKADRNYQECLAICARYLADTELHANILMAAGGFQVLFGDRERGISLLQQGISLPVESDPLVKANAYNHLGVSAYQQDKHGLALDYLQKAIRLARCHPVTSEELTRSLLHIGQLFQDMGKNDEAEASYREALALAASSPDSESMLQVDGMRLLSQLLTTEDRHAESLTLLVEAKSLLGKATGQSLPEQFILINSAISNQQWLLGNAKAAMASCQEAIEIAEAVWSDEDKQTITLRENLYRIKANINASRQNRDLTDSFNDSSELPEHD